MTPPARLPALAALIVVTLASGVGQGAEPLALPPGVIVLRPFVDDRVLAEASWRVRSELDGAGVSSRMVDCPGGAGAAGRSCGDDEVSVARIALSREEGMVTITVAATLPDGLELRRHVRVAPEQGGDEPAVIAVRAVELLRDIYLDIPRAARPSPPRLVVRPPAPRPEPTPTIAVVSPAPEGRSGQVFGGVAVLTGREGLGPAVAPYAGVGLSVSRFLAVAMIAGPFSRRLGRPAAPLMVQSTEVDVGQSLLTLGLRYEIAAWRVRPFATVATGLHYVSVRGVSSDFGDTSVTSTSLAPLLAAGAGVSVQIWKWLFFSSEMAALVSNPSVDVTVRGEVVGSAGAPSFLARAGLVIAP